MEGIVEYSDWEKLNLVVAQIKKVEEIEGADKLWKLTIDAGDEIGERVICAGIKEYYSKEELVDRKIIYFENLKPRIMRGIESQGMLLAAVSVPQGCTPRTEGSTGGKEHSKVELISPGNAEIGWKIS